MALDLLTTIELDMQNPYSSSSIVHVNQYDTAGRIKAQLLNGGVKWQVPQGAKPVVMFKKTDNIGGFYDVTELNPSTAAVTVDGSDSSIIYITLDQQTTTTATPTGQYVNMQVAFYQNSARLSTFAFHMQVAESVVTSGDIHSNWLFNILSQEIAQVITVAMTPEAMRQWLSEHISNPNSPPLDRTLSSPVSAAPADMVGDLKTALNNSETVSVDGLSQLGYSVDMHLEQGEIAGNTGLPVTTPNSKRVRSNRLIPLASGVTYHVIPQGHTFYVFFYDMNGTYISGQNLWGKYQPFDIVLPSGAFYIKIMVANNAQTDIVPTDVLDSERPYCIGDGNLATEVIIARGNNATLDDRLDNLDITTDSFYGFTYDLPFEQGAISGNGAPYGSTTDIRTGFIKVMPSKYKVEVNGYRAYALFYDKTKTFINGRNIWGKTADFKFETDESVGYVRLVANLTSGAEITPVDNALTLIDLGLYKDTKYLVDSTVIIPSYYFANDYLQNKEQAIIENCLVEKGSSFIFITDLHLEANSKSSKGIVKHVIDNTPVSFIVSGGDIPTAYSSVVGNEKAEVLQDVQEWMTWIDWWGQDRVYQLRGNHDYVKPARNDASKYYNILNGGVHQIVMPKFIERVHAPNPEMNYYYFDNETQKIRYIVLDPHTYNASYPTVVISWMYMAQFEWLANLLLNSNGYSIVIINHEAFDSSMDAYSSNLAAVGRLIDAFKTRDVFNEWYQDGVVNVDYTNSTGELVCFLSGHSHRDEYHVDASGVLSISTTCDAYYAEAGAVRTIGTVLESAFDVFSIDTEAKTIKTVRVGAGNNRGWNYITGEVIS